MGLEKNMRAGNESIMTYVKSVDTFLSDRTGRCEQEGPIDVIELKDGRVITIDDDWLILFDSKEDMHRKIDDLGSRPFLSLKKWTIAT